MEYAIELHKFKHCNAENIEWDQRIIDMNVFEVSRALKEYRVPLDLLKRYPFLKKQCHIGDDGAVLSQPSVKMDKQLYAAQKLIDK